MVYYSRTRSCMTRHPSRGTSTAWSTTPGLGHVGADTPVEGPPQHGLVYYSRTRSCRSRHPSRQTSRTRTLRCRRRSSRSVFQSTPLPQTLLPAQPFIFTLFFLAYFFSTSRTGQVRQHFLLTSSHKRNSSE